MAAAKGWRTEKTTIFSIIKIKSLKRRDKYMAVRSQKSDGNTHWPLYIHITGESRTS